jgi:type I restriction enzyme S subunit
MSEAFSGGSNGTKVSGWPIVSFTEILADQPRNGWSPPAAHHSPSGVPVLTLSSVIHFQFDGSRVKYTSAPTKKDAHYWLREGELLISRSNTAELVGHAAIYDGTPSPGICCDLIMKMRVDGGRASTGFVHYFLQTETARDYLKARAGGASATMQKINKSIVQELPVPVPPLPEQERIVAILDEAFEGIATATAHAERNLHNARELFQSVLQSTFQQKGEDWVETTLKDEVDFAAGFAFKSKGYVKNGEDGIRLLRGDNIMQGEFRWESAALWPSDDVEAYTKFHLEENDVVLAMDRPWVSAGLKISSVSSKDLPCLQVQRTARLRVGDKLSWQYLFHLLRSREFIDYILGGQTGLGVPHISGKQILSFHFGRPPIKQQKAIVQKLDALATETRRLEAIYQRKLAALAELKQSLLQRAFAGEL